jgi:hypothetical protein
MSNQIKSAISTALKASSRATVRPAAKPYSSGVEQLYRTQIRQVEEMLGLHPRKKEGPVGQFLDGIGAVFGSVGVLIVLLYVLSHV